MNTTKKGDLFEDKVHDIILEHLIQDKFFTPGKRSLLFKKHKYFSKDRGKNIIFDLVIEVYRDGAEKPNMIILIECKDKKRPISVHDVEAFESKKQQVARANSKCVIFTTSELQEGALNFAASIGMAVVRILDDDSLMWFVERTNKNLTTTTNNTVMVNVMNALTTKFFVTTNQKTFAFFNNRPYNKIDELLLDILKE